MKNILNRIDNLAKVAAMKRHLSCHPDLVEKIGNPEFFHQAVINSGLCESLTKTRTEFVDFFRSSLKSAFTGIDKFAVKAAIGNVVENARNEASWFRDGDGAENIENGDDIANGIGRIGDLLELSELACDDQSLEVPGSAPEEIYAPFDRQDRNTMLAALRYYQQEGMGNPAVRSDVINEIATDGDTDVSMDDSGIDDLCERINTAQQPRALVVIFGGNADYATDKGVDLEVFDWDNYNAGDRDQRVPAHFADLADLFHNIPLEGQDEVVSDKPV
jgi:hypothetical protein